MMNRRHALGLILTTPLIARPAWAASPDFFAVDGLAIRGADPVAFFDGDGPMVAQTDHRLMWRGATWQFASAENQARFEAEPDTFAPQYGGYCAYAASKGYVATSVPEAWTVHEGKLYLNYSVNVRGIWSQDIEGNVARADANWPAILAN